MSQNNTVTIQKENDLKKVYELILRNYPFFLICLFTAVLLAFFYIKFSVPVYKISASMLLKEDKQQSNKDINEYINSSLFGTDQNFQNELWVLKSTPVIMQTIENLNLFINYYQKDGLIYRDAYKEAPFRVLIPSDHVQPVDIRFNVTIAGKGSVTVEANGKKVSFYDYSTDKTVKESDYWSFSRTIKSGSLVETPELAFMIELNPNFNGSADGSYSFIFFDRNSIKNNIKDQMEFNIIDKQATVIQIVCKSPSVLKGEDIVNELMNVYSNQNLARKNHIAGISIDYIEKQLNEISDSLNMTEKNLQLFRSSNQLLDVAEQATGISAQYMDLQNQLAEMVTRKKYYDYVSEYLSENDDFSNIMVPASMGIQDQLLNTLLSDLIKAQATRSNLIENKQEKNPMVQRLNIQIENTKKTITENIDAVRKTTEMTIDEMNRRISSVEAKISRIPGTQRQLGGIERKYRLNDAIFNYLLQKRAEAKITQASNMPDNIIIEPAKMDGEGPISPNVMMIYLLALFFGAGGPFVLLMIRGVIKDKLEPSDNINKLSHIPVVGKIMHSRLKTNQVMLDHPRSNVAESYRVLRTNIEYQFKQNPRKVMLVTSCIEGEGKSFNALNLAISYAQMDRKVMLMDFDLRKKKDFFDEKANGAAGLSSYLTDKVELNEIIKHTDHKNLDYISSGPIPPNPAELLSREKTLTLINILKQQYDHIIIDTPPLAQVTDAFILLAHADINLIVARYNYTVKTIFSLVMNDLKQKDITNACLVLNDNRFYRDQYGYGYGYNRK